MTLQQKIITARAKQGLTQEQLADTCGITVRTIQRIESGATIPRSFTLKAIASALQIPFEELNEERLPPRDIDPPITSPGTNKEEDERYFLKMLCLSCFSFLLIPYLHFLIPAYLLKKQHLQNPYAVRFARWVIQWQVYWVVLNIVVFLIVLAYNLAMTANHMRGYTISYLLVFFILYFSNAAIIIVSYKKASDLNLQTQKIA